MSHRVWGVPFLFIHLINHQMKRLLILSLFWAAILPMLAQTDPLAGKRIAFIGDSYVYNHRQPQSYTWHYKFAKKHGMTYFNYGINGTCICRDRMGKPGEAVYKRVTQMNDSLDYIVIVAGHNDACRMLPDMVRPDTVTEDLLRAKLAYICDTLIAKYPRAGIFFFTPWPRPDYPNMERVTDIIKEVAGHYGIPVFDSRQSGIHAGSAAFRKLYFQTPDDNAHLNAAGHDRFLPVAEDFLLKYMH
jgi:lysophospholipase L1-like esterase